MREPMDREELIESALRCLSWLVWDDKDDPFYDRMPLTNETIQRSLREACSFLEAARDYKEVKHGV